MLNTDNTDAIMLKSELWLMCRPGHILILISVINNLKEKEVI